MKIFLFLLVLTVPGLASARPELPMTVKQRLRILLWTEGLKEEKAKNPTEVPSKIKLPEEIERPLRYL